MALDDLERERILLPREQWGQRDLHTRVAKLPLLIVTAGAIAAAALMYVGNGQILTWAGFVLFLMSLFGFTWLSLRGIQ